MSIAVIGWQWLLQAAVAKEKLAAGASESDRAFYEGKLCTAQYWLQTEMPRIEQLAELCRNGEDSYARMHPDWF